MTNTIVIAEGLLGEERGAMFCGDECGGSEPDCHRYELWRVWDPTVQPVLFVMLNPSVADHNKLDRTVRRCIGYAQQWGYGGLYVGNLYGFRATDKDEMLASDDPVGEHNMDALKRMAALAGRIVVAWGSTPEAVAGHRAEVLALLREHGPGELYALKVLNGGHPGHPLYLDKRLKPEVYVDS